MKLPLLARHDIHLQDFGSEKQGARFAAVFRDTWQRLPLSARRALLAHWRAPDVFCFDSRRSPRVAIVHYLSRVDDPDVMGVCRLKGHEFQFQVGAVAALPDEHLATLIAHELCHGYLAAKKHPDADGSEWEENLVQEINGIEWGFDEDALDDYCDAIGRPYPWRADRE